MTVPQRSHWVVQDQSGLRGGLFVDRVEALKFAMFETGNRPQAVNHGPESGIIELEMSGLRPQVAELIKLGPEHGERCQRRARWKRSWRRRRGGHIPSA